MDNTSPEDGKTPSIPTGPLSRFVATRSGEWRLTERRIGRKIRFELVSPLWRGEVALTAAELLSHRRVRRAVLEQRGVLLPNSFEGLWHGQHVFCSPSGEFEVSWDAGLLAKLMPAAKEPA